jgi:hypothetical protein
VNDGTIGAVLDIGTSKSINTVLFGSLFCFSAADLTQPLLILNVSKMENATRLATNNQSKLNGIKPSSS